MSIDPWDVIVSRIFFGVHIYNITNNGEYMNDVVKAEQLILEGLEILTDICHANNKRRLWYDANNPFHVGNSIPEQYRRDLSANERVHEYYNEIYLSQNKKAEVVFASRPEGFYGVGDVAEIMGISLSTFQGRCKRKYNPYPMAARQVPGRTRLYYSAEDVLDIIEKFGQEDK
jgi:hypothetical protein